MCSENGQQQLQHVWQVRENYAEKRATKSVEWKSAFCPKVKKIKQKNLMNEIKINEIKYKTT